MRKRLRTMRFIRKEFEYYERKIRTRTKSNKLR